MPISLHTLNAPFVVRMLELMIIMKFVARGETGKKFHFKIAKMEN